MEKEKTYGLMNDFEQGRVVDDVCMTQPVGKRGLDEYMGEEYANSIVYDRTPTQIKKDIAWFQKMIIDGGLHK